MATQEPEQDNALSKVARSVGSALGAVTSKVNGLVGDKTDADGKSEPKPAESVDTDTKSSEKSESKPARASSGTATKAVPAKKTTAQAAAESKSHTQQVKKLKRDKHRRKLGRKTRG